jgi:FixJ family two-component response regulator
MPRKGTMLAPDTSTEVFVVDDDSAIRDMLSMVFSKAGYEVVCFAEGASFLAAAKVRTPACVILDVHIPGKSGLDILRGLNAQDYPVPIFIMSGSGDIPMAVEAIKNGAFDFVQKPFKGSEIVTRVKEAISAQAARRANPAPPVSLHFPGREPLSRREQDVLACLASGASNKIAARQLGISPRTVEVHRARIMEKLGARNATDLMRIVLSEGRPS